ncbi:hypothetical protein LEAN103870_15960 [Legionella anisa]|uniref:Uncharacterized protein n=1 Tax=Legionella anisa TaxID=28082 RepID=A0AAX0WSM9_9GAMM|nr:hypothetical protein [Legionella anisa]AWN74958.1 hypothetical protein DLD14_14555 [Legionella anisa]KTC72274.1 hypothetical protein Lani_1408 [Legionella anisa]MCW8424839.1 hypothetical protein [Legionella anisa]MCW8446042.1 hypothetical protein [Legionella anisa]PNL61085.1 hypothetical protein A6J39_007585 [Legionella anisa]
MSKFPHITPAELRRYFNRLNLNQLLEINHSYGPHFISLDNRIDKCNADLRTANSRLAELQISKQTHDQNYDNVEIREAEFKLRLQSVLADSDQTARYIGRQAVGSSPMALFSIEDQYLAMEISNVSQTIRDLNETIADLEQKKKGAVSELRILNSVIELKRQHLPVPVPASNQFGL